MDKIFHTDNEDDIKNFKASHFFVFSNGDSPEFVTTNSNIAIEREDVFMDCFDSTGHKIIAFKRINFHPEDEIAMVNYVVRQRWIEENELYSLDYRWTVNF